MVVSSLIKSNEKLESLDDRIERMLSCCVRSGSSDEELVNWLLIKSVLRQLAISRGSSVDEPLIVREEITDLLDFPIPVTV